MVLLFGIGEGEEKEQWVFWIFSLLGLFHGGARIKIKQCAICGFCRG
jgi:hypothetical protein